MPRLVAILEDNPRRVLEMRTCLGACLPWHEVVVFDTAAAMMDWLEQHAGETELISLDHDLPIGRHRNCGCGRDVADFLAARSPTCPVIVHSSNDVGASGMYFALTRAGWPCKRVYPRDDLRWVGDAWLEHVRALARDGWFDPHE